jgi:hypothetical protein
MKEEHCLKGNGIIVGPDSGNLLFFHLIVYLILLILSSFISRRQNSVTWVVEELITEYASQIEDHMNKIASCIQNNHWRTNPSVLAGMRIAVFRKGTGPVPTVITG